MRILLAAVPVVNLTDFGKEQYLMLLWEHDDATITREHIHFEDLSESLKQSFNAQDFEQSVYLGEVLEYLEKRGGVT